MDVGRMLQRATQARELTDEEMDGYRAPFPKETHMAGAREFPALAPITADHPGVAENLAAWEVLERWDKPSLTLWCPDDPVLGGLNKEFIERVPGAAGAPHQGLFPGGHFIQDDRGEDVAAALVEWLSRIRARADEAASDHVVPAATCRTPRTQIDLPPQSKVMTVRVTVPASRTSRAWSSSDSGRRALIMASRSSLPWR